MVSQGRNRCPQPPARPRTASQPLFGSLGLGAGEGHQGCLGLAHLALAPAGPAGPLGSVFWTPPAPSGAPDSCLVPFQAPSGSPEVSSPALGCFRWGCTLGLEPVLPSLALVPGSGRCAPTRGPWTRPVPPTPLFFPFWHVRATMGVPGRFHPPLWTWAPGTWGAGWEASRLTRPEAEQLGDRQGRQRLLFFFYQVPALRSGLSSHLQSMPPGSPRLSLCSVLAGSWAFSASASGLSR